MHMCLCLLTQVGVDPRSGRPTLMLIRDTADQATKDLHRGLQGLEAALNLLRSPDAALSDAVVTQRLRQFGGDGELHDVSIQ